MKICAVSDLHGCLDFETPESDVLILAGDLCPNFHNRFWANDRECKAQGIWLGTKFREWLKRQPARHKIATLGNHDIVGDHPEWMPDLPWTLLLDQSVEIEGVKFYGSPWCVEFMDWSFNLPEEKLAEKYSLIPADTDVLISHGPPYGFGDQIEPGSEHLGSTSLAERIKELKILLTVCGHIHGGNGVYELATGEWPSVVANVSLLNEQYELVNVPLECECTPSETLAPKADEGRG
jgi:Icc-related predicted phosphoesterase